MDSTVKKDKPWRPADHPAPGPSWNVDNDDPKYEPRVIPDPED